MKMKKKRAREKKGKMLCSGNSKRPKLKSAFENYYVLPKNIQGSRSKPWGK